MPEKLSNRPIVAREDDLSELNDYTLSDIATAKLTSPEDRQTAKAEIARRQAAGTYDPDSAPHASRTDLTSNGYSVENGQILYPKPEYKAWLKSDRSLTPPTGVYRETLADRAKALDVDIASELEASNDINEATRETAQSIGKTALEKSIQSITPAEEIIDNTSEDVVSQGYDLYDELFGREKIHHPNKYISKKEQRLRKYEASAKPREAEIDSRRKFKSSNKYDNTNYNPGKVAAKEARGNLPIVENSVSSPEYTIPPEKSLERALDKVNLRLKRHFKEYYIEGAIDALSHGRLDINPRGFITNGFLQAEKADVDLGIPEDLQTAFWDNIKFENIPDKVRDWDTEETVRSAEKEALLEAISRGGSIEQSSLDQPPRLQLDLPILKYGKNSLPAFLREYGIETKSEEARDESYSGFINIIDAIKGGDQFDKDGFAALDWYFDNFDYASKLSEQGGLLDIVEGYKSTADSLWANKLTNYLQTRPEYRQYIETMNSPEQKAQDVENIEKTTPVSFEDYQKQVSEKLGISIEELNNIGSLANLILGDVLPPEPTSRIIISHDKPAIRYPKTFAKQKILTVYATYALLRSTGRDFNAEIFQEVDHTTHPSNENNQEKNDRRIKIGGERYTVLRFGCKNDDGIEENHAIAEGDSPASATYIWHGQGDGWKDAFINRYKRDAKNQPGVSTKNHDHDKSPIDHMISIMSKLGIDLIDLAGQALGQFDDSSTEAQGA